MTTPLKLKSERVGKVPLATDRPYISVLVDTGVLHLDSPYSYLLPVKVNVEPGDWVSVPFNGRNLQALVVDRSNNSIPGKLLTLNRQVKGPYISPSHLKFYQAVAKRWAVPLFDVLRFTSKYRNKKEQKSLPSESKRGYLQLSASNNEITEVIQFAKTIARKGRTLLVIPEARLLPYFEGFDFEVGMRASILTPESYSNILILREESENLYELKSPGFNVRDVALLRNEILQESIYFLGYSPSIEMARLIDKGYVPTKRVRSKVSIKSTPSNQGELIPSQLFKSVKDFIATGTLLVIAPNKGYGLAISCASCRNIATCTCGGKLSKRSRSDDPACVICGLVYPNWRCNHCHSERIYLLGRGIERIAEEFGKTFRNIPIHIATAEKEIDDVVRKGSVVIATIGSAPIQNYSAVLFLDGLHLSSDLRAEERYLSTLFRYTAMANGNALVVQRPEHPAISALTSWNSFGYLNRLIRDLEEVKLPPHTRHALLKSEQEESGRIANGLLAAIREDRLPADSRVIQISDDVISLFFPIKSGAITTDFLYQFQKRRSMSGKLLLKMRIDPYLLG